MKKQLNLRAAIHSFPFFLSFHWKGPNLKSLIGESCLLLFPCLFVNVREQLSALAAQSNMENRAGCPHFLTGNAKV